MISVDVDSARTNMLLNQVRACEVLDLHVLELLRVVPRERFVPDPYRNLAFADQMLPIGHGQVMFSPMCEGRFLQALAVRPSDKVLEVGTGTGYMAALLSKVARSVMTIDIFEDFVASARQRLTRGGYGNVEVLLGDAALGWPTAGPYDVILVTGSLPILPPAYVNQLNPGGRLGVIIGHGPAMQAQVLTVRTSKGIHVSSLFETEVPPLLNAPQPDSFVF